MYSKEKWLTECECALNGANDQGITKGHERDLTHWTTNVGEACATTVMNKVTWLEIVAKNGDSEIKSEAEVDAGVEVGEVEVDAAEVAAVEAGVEVAAVEIEIGEEPGVSIVAIEGEEEIGAILDRNAEIVVIDPVDETVVIDPVGETVEINHVDVTGELAQKVIDGISEVHLRGAVEVDAVIDLIKVNLGKKVHHRVSEELGLIVDRGAINHTARKEMMTIGSSQGHQIKEGLPVKGKIQEVQGLQEIAIDLKVNAVSDQEVNAVNNDLEVDVLLARDSNQNRDKDHLVIKVDEDLEATSDLTRQIRQEVDLDLGVIVKDQ